MQAMNPVSGAHNGKPTLPTLCFIHIHELAVCSEQLPGLRATQSNWGLQPKAHSLLSTEGGSWGSALRKHRLFPPDTLWGCSDPGPLSPAWPLPRGSGPGRP